MNLPHSAAPVGAGDAATAPAGPDFLCIGMAKAGTGWLGDQLRHHPQFWMPPVQELAYLGRDAPALKSANRKLPRLRERAARRRKRPPKRPVDPRDVAFLEDITACTGQPRDLDRYVSFFRHKGASITGDISPGYCTLETEIIRKLTTKLPHLRVMLLVRDPLQRLWSHICMWHRNGKFDEALLAAPAKFRAYLASAEIANERSSPTEIIAHWKNSAPGIAFRHFFFDDIVTRPECARADVLAFLGADPKLASSGVAAGYNRKSEVAKLELDDATRAILIEHCRSEIRACARELGGWANAWAASYGL